MPWTWPRQWAIACTREALEDYGYPKRPLNLDRTAVILGNAMGGEKHYLTSLRVYFPEYARELAESASFAALPRPCSANHLGELHDRIGKRLPDITRRHHARRVGQLHRRPHRQPLQLPRPEFHHRRGLRLGDGGHQCGSRRLGRRTISTWPSPAASTATWALRPS